MPPFSLNWIMSGYFQVRVDEEKMEKTAFPPIMAIMNGFYAIWLDKRFQHFQMMNQVLAPLSTNSCKFILTISSITLHQNKSTTIIEEKSSNCERKPFDIKKEKMIFSLQIFRIFRSHNRQGRDSD